MKDRCRAAADTQDAAAEHGTDLIQGTVCRIQPLVEQAGEKVKPLAHQAKVRTADFASRRLDQIQPALNEALDKVTPAVDSARLKVQDDLLPRLQELLHEFAEHTPAIPEPTPAEIKAARKAEKRVRRKARAKKTLKILAIGALVASVVAAIKQFLESEDDGWTAHEPSKAYVHTRDNFAASQESEVEQSDSAETTEDAANPNYGEGAYVGEEPPAGFFIKGNERSMKYHMPGTGGYERTIPDVWFNSEKAASAAGFTRAQR